MELVVLMSLLESHFYLLIVLHCACSLIFVIVMNEVNSGKLNKYLNHVGEVIQQIEDALAIRDALHHKDGRALYSELYDKVHYLQVLSMKMKIVLEQDRKNIGDFEKKLSNMKLLETRIDGMMVFAVQNCTVDNTSISSVPSALKEASCDLDDNKENEIEKKKPQPSRKMGVPSLNLLTEEKFQSIPKYTKGHLTLSQVNAGITEINTILCKKYELLNKPRKQLSLKDDRKRAIYLEQANDLKGSRYCVFFIDEDIQQYGTVLKLKRKTKDNIFLVLRHLGRMKEVHKAKLTRYCILTA